MIRIYFTILLIGCSLTTALAQDDTRKLVKTQTEIVSNVDAVVDSAISLTDRVKTLEATIEECKKGHLEIDKVYINLPFNMMSVDALKVMRDYYTAEQDANMLAMIDARIELCAKLTEYSKLLNSDFDIMKVSDAASYLHTVVSNLPLLVNKYSLSDSQQDNIKEAYKQMLAYYDGLSAICGKLIPQVDSYRQNYGNNTQAVCIKIAEYIVKAEWKEQVNKYITKVPYLNNLYNNYVSALYNNPIGGKTIELETRFKNFVKVE